jgi:replicative DNA helicase
MMTELSTLRPNYSIPSVDIAHDDSRVTEFIERSASKDSWCIPTGFEELDDIVGGWETSEEFVVFFARTNQGKSWILVKTVEHAWKIGKNVGYISPEMSANKLAYRFDTLHNNFSNTALMRGDLSKVSAEAYQAYSEKLAKSENKFLVSTPADFGKKITVSKLRTYVLNNNLDMLAIDGITYLTDERYKRGDNKTISLTNISEDLMQLSCDLQIPILVVVQSNRGGVKEEENATPELEDIRDSDGISHNATKVIALKQKEQNLIMSIKKSRYGKVGDKLTYRWDIDKGEFEWMADINDTASIVKKEERRKQVMEEYAPKGKVVF